MTLSKAQQKSLTKITQIWTEEPPWTNADAGALRAFLATVSGQRLSAQLRNASISLNSQACLSEDPVRDGNRAAGYMIAISDLQNLSAQVEPTNDQSEDDVSEETDIKLDLIASSKNRKV